MKMFIVNITSARSSAVRKFLFINALNRFKGIQINPSVSPSSGVPMSASTTQTGTTYPIACVVTLF